MEPLLLLWLLLWPLSSLRGWPRNVAKIPGKEGAEGGRREEGRSINLIVQMIYGRDLKQEAGSPPPPPPVRASSKE